jgi:hypothetical protein
MTGEQAELLDFELAGAGFRVQDILAAFLSVASAANAGIVHSQVRHRRLIREYREALAVSLMAAKCEAIVLCT